MMPEPVALYNSTFSLSLSFSHSPAKARQMEGGAAVQSEQMAAPNLIYEINNVSQI